MRLLLLLRAVQCVRQTAVHGMGADSMGSLGCSNLGCSFPGIMYCRFAGGFKETER
jgi:hypothetical protein